jgi:hypothetical protein
MKYRVYEIKLKSGLKKWRGECGEATTTPWPGIGQIQTITAPPTCHCVKRASRNPYIPFRGKNTKKRKIAIDIGLIMWYYLGGKTLYLDNLIRAVPSFQGEYSIPAMDTKHGTPNNGDMQVTGNCWIQAR